MRFLQAHSIVCVILVAVVGWASSSAATPPPGDPSGSTLGPAPGTTGAVGINTSRDVQSVIPVGPGPSYPRVPRGITQPPEPFGTPTTGLAIERLPIVAGAESSVFGRAAVPIHDLQGPPNGLTIDQAIDRLLSVNLELRAQALEISKARADVLTAGLRGNPLMYVDTAQIPYGNFDGSAGGPTQTDVNITLPVDLNQKRKRRIDVAVRAQKVTEALFQDAVRLQLDNLYTAWIDVLNAEATIRFLESGLESLTAQKRVAQELATKRATSQREVNKIEIQINSTDLMLLEARETHSDSKRTLAALLSIPLEKAETFPIRGSVRGAPVVTPPVNILIEQALANRPDLAAYRLGVQRAASEVRLAQANRIDDVFVLYQPITIQQRLQPGESTAQSWALGVTVPLPVFNRQQGNIARAETTVAQTKIQLVNLERQVILEVQRADAANAVTRATIKRLEENILPAARENLGISLKESGTDMAGVISRIEAQRAFGEISRQYLEALVRHRRSMLRINTAVGARVLR
jgi:cobalt-zinc-cadmium efflux system outer membrane protein